MANLKLVTLYVVPDEPCYGLYEGPANIPQVNGSTLNRWVQDIIVIRDDAKAHYVSDLGPAEDYQNITPLLMPSFGENTVAQLQAFAEKNRDDDYWHKRAIELQASSTLIADHVRQVEIDHEVINNRSVFGPAISVARNEYSQTRLRRKLRDKINKYYGWRSYG